jgi:RNA polymerase sigma factor (sigma-70 family)
MAVAESDADRFTVLFRRHYPQVLAYARRRVGPEACEEVVADTFTVAWRRFATIPEPALPWLYKVAMFTIANHRRREATAAQAREGSDLERREPSHDFSEDSIDSDRLRHAYASLSPQDREILRLAGWEGLSAADGAVVLSCSVAAYKVRLHRARSRLAANVRPSPPGLPAVGRDRESTVSQSDDPALSRASEEPT